MGTPSVQSVYNDLSFRTSLVYPYSKTITFVPDDRLTEDMKDAPAVQAARDAYEKTGESVPIIEETFGLLGPIRSGLNPGQQQMGGFMGKLTVNPDGSITFTIDNYLTPYSFFYHYFFLPPFLTPVLPREVSKGPMATIHQHLEWTEPAPTPPCPQKKEEKEGE